VQRTWKRKLEDCKAWRQTGESADRKTRHQDLSKPCIRLCLCRNRFDFKEADILLYDMSGRQLQSLKTKNNVTKINTQSLVQGAYLVTIKTDNNKTANAKLIKK
jgi:hypothetical protein